jgi:signal transduction histidine kinase
VSWPVSAATVLTVVLAVLVESVTENALVADVCYLGVVVGAGAAAWIGLSRWPRPKRLMPGLIAAGVSLNAIGEVLWTVLYRAGADPDVSIADLAYLASYIFLCAALWMILSRSRNDGRAGGLGFVVDAATIVMVSVLIFWNLTVDAIVDDATVSPLARTVWASYPVLDAVLLALVVRALLSRSSRAAIGVWFAVGVSLWLAADILYLRSSEGLAAVAIMNAGWMVAPVLMARAAWPARGMRTEAITESAERAARKGWLGLLLIAVCPLIVPPALELVAHLRGKEDEPLQLLVGTAAVTALALVRTGRLILSEQRAQAEVESARDAALAASEAKTMFMANMSHELRTPLTSVLVASELLKSTPLDDLQVNLLGKVHRSGERLQSLVEGLLDFSRIEAGRAVLHPAEFDLYALVADIADAHLPKARAQEILLEWEIDPRVPHTVVGDRTKVFQVLSNLVENAVKFSANGRVALEVGPADADSEWPSGCVEFSVSDTGIGIHEKDQASVFLSFTQVDGSASRRYAGTGLGLAICKELTELMGGTISLHSRLGEGSTFTVWLPLPQRQRQPPMPVAGGGPGDVSA